MENQIQREKKFNTVITIVSILIPLVVAVLFGVKIPGVAPLSILPPIYATINGLTALVLIMAVFAIKNGQRKRHETLMKTAIVFSLIFLVMYVAYHMTSESTPFGGVGAVVYVYYFILISHIILSIAIIPLVLKTYAKAYLKQFEAHKKLAKITFPIWLYVAITGVVVYFMIAPYYTY